MANNDPGQRGPSWRKQPAPPPPASRPTPGEASAPTGSSPSRGWKNRPVESKSSLGEWFRSRKARVVTAISLTGVLIAFFVFLIIIIRPVHPACLVLIGSPAEENLAVDANVAGWQTLQRINQWVTEADDVKLPRMLAKEPKDLHNLDDWDKGWQDRREKAIVVYLALHGGVDNDGPFFWLDAPAGQASGTRLLLRTVLASLGKLPADKQKVLILDPTQVPVNWHQGMLHNDFVRALLKLEPEISQVPNLVVLCSSDVDQRSWVSEEWQQSIFGHYLAAGLRGAAIRNKGNNHLTVGDLHNYVHEHVDRWVQTNRNRKQTPLLLPRDKGKALAEQIELAAVDGQDDPDPKDSPGAGFHASADLDAVWAQSEALAKLVPSPGVYSPQRWREYRDLSLRYEQVARIGDPRQKGASLLRRLNDLDREIRQAHGLSIPSASSTLAMPMALGVIAPWTPAEMQEQFRSLWNAPDEAARQKTWEGVNKWLAGKGGSSEQLRLQMTGLLLEQVLGNPGSIDVAQVNAIFQLLGTPRPAEGHFLFMYLYLNQKLLPKLPSDQKVPSDLLAQALKLRRSAEEVALACNALRGEHPYSEHIYPWIREKVEAADRERRLGEDLLFAPQPYWKESGDHLSKATAVYDSASKDAKLLRRALTLRDRALADLPYYARWLANAPPGSDEETLYQDQEKLWVLVHQLAQALGLPTDAAQRDTQLKTLAELLDSKQLQRDLEASLARLVSQAENLADAATQQNWHLHAQALSIPSMTRAVVRKQRVETFRRIADDLNRKSLQNLPSQDEPVAQHAARQGRMAWAVLGEANVRRFLPNQDIGWVRGLIQNRSDEWPTSVRQFGDFVGQCWGLMPGKIEELSLASPDRPEQFRTDLSLADLLTRQLDGAGSSRIAPRDPPVELRKLRWHDLLLQQADRTYHDHWAAERAGEPYYRQIGLRYIDDAQSLIADKGKPADKDPRLAQVRQARQHMANQLPIEIQGAVQARKIKDGQPEQLDWTSERRLSLTFHLQPVADLLPGYPVVWRTFDVTRPDDKPLALVEGKETDRLVADLATKPVKSLPLLVDLEDRWLDHDERKPPTVPTKELVPFTLHTVFRGHNLPHPTNINLHRVPHTTGIVYPRPDVGGVALQADGPALQRFGQSNGVISIVFDCSGSMTWDIKLKDGTMGKPINEAKKALAAFLSDLPNGPVVTVWVFGTAKGAKEGGIERIWEPQPWDATPRTGHLPRLMAALDACKPDNSAGSPIAKTVVEHAAKDFALIADKFPQQNSGFKTMLILTDGDDNWFPFENKGKDVGEYIRKAYQDLGVQINYVLYEHHLTGDDLKQHANAKKQFAVIEKLPVPGKILEAPDEVKLKDLLNTALRRELRCRLERNGVPVPGQESVLVGPLDKPPRWFSPLAPHLYTLRAYTDFKQDIDVGTGDFISVKMTDEPKTRQISFERGLLVRNYPSKDQDQSGKWIMACFQNMRTAHGGLQLVSTLENTDVKPTLDNRPEAPRGTLVQVRPGFVWFAVGPGDGPPPPLCLRWSNMERFPAPAWKLEVSSWPKQPDEKPMKPVVDAWWLGEREPVAGTKSLNRDPAKSLDEDFANRSVPIEEGSVVIESVQIEKRPVQVAPDRTVEQSCLVVRLRYPVGRPVVVQLQDVPVSGGEHRLYSDANKYTGIFWPMDEARAKQFKMQLISLEAFKQAAKQTESGVHHGRLLKLAEPQLGDLLLVTPVP